MKKIIATALTLTLLFYILPLLWTTKGDKPQAEPGTTGESTAPAPETPAASGHTLQVLLDGQVQTMALNDYIWGVVAAEMPASFEPEALKAQAVAARTYALRKAQSKAHGNADICGNSACCQAYISKEKAAKNWGAEAEAYTEKIRQAVDGTGEEVILYQGELISAVFHACAAGSTVDAVAVWGGTVPYLVGVDSPEGEEVPNYRTQVKYSLAEFKQKILAQYPEAKLEGAPAGWFQDAERTAGGSVVAVTVGGVRMKGGELRTLFGLRSATFTVEPSETELIFHVTGYGHGVGMSQYGANTMAKEGKNYQEILRWYYTGVSIEPCPAALFQTP